MLTGRSSGRDGSSVRYPGRGLALTLALVVAGCGPNATPIPTGPSGTAGSQPVQSGGSESSSPAGGGPAPSCAPIPPVAPPVTSLGQPGWWRDRVFAEIFVRSYGDGDGDGVGDLGGLTARLDYLNDGDPATATDLGITGLWLMPTFPSPSYHGYDVTDYLSVNPDYGSLADLRELVAGAHERGIAVILDLPLNHTSSKHPWFIASEKGEAPYVDSYVWSDAPQGSNWQPDGKRFFYANFGADLPDLNLRNADVTAELTAAARFWLTDIGVDGFRLDAAKYLIEDGATTENTPETHAWWRTFRQSIEAVAPGALLLGEVWDTPQASSSYVPDDLDLTFDFALAGAEVGAVQSGDGDGLSRVLAKVSSLYPPSGGFGAFLSNHDQDRLASQLGGDPAEMRLAADLLLTGPGVPFIYYGEEIGMTGRKPDERIRTPMRWDGSSPAAGFSIHEPWEALSDDPATTNVAAESADPASLLSHYRDLIRLRVSHPALAVGLFIPVASDLPGIVAALRASPTETALVLTNLSAAPVSPTLSLATGPLCGTPAADLILGAGTAAPPVVSSAGGFTGYQPLSAIPPRSSAVVALQP
jgi:alpha-amylase